MSFDAKTQAILSFLQAQAAAAPELAGEYAQMEDLYKRKLWHQLTCVLEAFMVLPGKVLRVILSYKEVRSTQHSGAALRTYPPLALLRSRELARGRTSVLFWLSTSARCEI